MHITFKDLSQQKFVIEAEPGELVSDLKEKISKEKGWAASTQKLIYSGKILQDDKTVEFYKIEEKGFIVCMVVNKTKSTPTPATSSSKAPSTPAPTVVSTPAPPAAPSQLSTAATVPPATPTPAGAGAGAGTGAGATPAESPSAFNDPSALTIGAQRAEAISNLEGMGFERAQIEIAMRAAFYNPDRAVEYLLNGIPENLQQESRARAAPAAAPTAGSPPPAQASGDEPVNLFEAAAQAGAGGRNTRAERGANPFAAAGTGAGAGAAAGATAGGLGNLDWLRSNPQFQQLRQVVQQQPQMLEPILQSVGAGNPQLAQLIGQHPDQFLQLLGEDGDDDAPLPPGAQAISVTEEEREAIERLCRLGFDRDQAIQAYFACDKNEELAANFLFEQPEDDEAN